MDTLPEDLASEPFLTNQHGDRYLYSVNHNTLNNEGARIIHAERFDPLLTRKDKLYFVVGTDSGTLLSYLQDHRPESGTQFVFIEPPELKKRLIEEDLIPDRGWLRVITLDELEQLYDEINLTSYLYIDSVILVKSLAAEYGFLARYHEIFFQLQEQIYQTLWDVQATLGNQPFINRQLENIADNLISSICLKNQFQHRTAVLLAGGPSLDEILPWVKDNRERLAVLAVSRISRRLLEVDLVPDMVFSIDPHQLSFDISREMLRFWQETVFIHVNHVNPKLLSQWRGRSLFVGDRVPWPSELNVTTMPSAGPTVSNFALAVATDMGFDRIILAGVDLCHSQQGFTHARGSNEFQAGPQLSHAGTRVMTNGGWLASTTSDFAAGIRILGAQAATAADRGINIINPAPGAAVIDHVVHLPLDQISLESPEKPVKELLHSLVPPATGEESLAYCQQVAAELTKVHGHLLKIRKLAREAITCNDGLFGRKGKKQHFKYKKRMDKIENRLKNEFSDLSRLIKAYGIRDFLKMTRVDQEAEWTDEEMARAADTYYEAYISTSSRLIDLVKKARTRVESRKAELSSASKLAELADQWRRDGVPGRVMVWLDRTGKAIEDLAENDQALALELQSEFEDLLTTQDTEHARRSRKFASLQGLLGKGLAFFQKQDANALADLITALDNHPDKRARTYQLLFRGYRAELEGNQQDALERYQEIFDRDQDTVLEEALRRISYITLDQQDIDNAELALETLTRISHHYLPRYGDLLRLLGRHQDALNAYISYIEYVPGDIPHLLKVGEYCMDLGIRDGAQTMFQHVLSLEPANARARNLLESL